MIGHVYKIIHLDSEIQYIGSTAGTVNDRWYQHKRTYKGWLSNKEKFGCVAIYPYFEKYSIDRFKMILIKSYDIVDKKHLYVYEQLAINKTKCVNQVAAISLIGRRCMYNHYYTANKQSLSEQMKKYRQSNKQAISKQRKLHYEVNKQPILERNKEYRQSNKQAISKYHTEYRETNREKIKEQKKIKVQCDCGSIVNKNNISIHRKSAKHIRLLAAQTN